jgi:hypothetical protein
VRPRRLDRPHPIRKHQTRIIDSLRHRNLNRRQRNPFRPRPIPTPKPRRRSKRFIALTTRIARPLKATLTHDNLRPLRAQRAPKQPIVSSTFPTHRKKSCRLFCTLESAGENAARTRHTGGEFSGSHHHYAIWREDYRCGRIPGAGDECSLFTNSVEKLDG